MPTGASGVSVSGRHQVTAAGCPSQARCQAASPTTRYDHTTAPVLKSNATIESKYEPGCSHDSLKKPFGGRVAGRNAVGLPVGLPEGAVDEAVRPGGQVDRRRREHRRTGVAARLTAVVRNRVGRPEDLARQRVQGDDVRPEGRINAAGPATPRRP